MPFPGDLEDNPVVNGECLMSAASRGDSLEVLRLLGKGASANAETPDQRCTPLSLAAENGYAAVIKLLGAARADVNWRSGKGSELGAAMPCLRLAAMGGHLEAVSALLAAGARPDLADAEGFSPLEAAATFGNASMVGALLCARASPSIALDRPSAGAPRGYSALHSAVNKGQVVTCPLIKIWHVFS